jgi:hypothetical protein
MDIDEAVAATVGARTDARSTTGARNCSTTQPFDQAGRREQAVPHVDVMAASTHRLRSTVDGDPSRHSHNRRQRVSHYGDGASGGGAPAPGLARSLLTGTVIGNWQATSPVVDPGEPIGAWPVAAIVRQRGGRQRTQRAADAHTRVPRTQHHEV